MDQQVDPVTKRFLPKVSKEQRAEYIVDALDRLENGETANDIAKDYNVTGATLCGWLLIDAPEDATNARGRFLSKKLATHIIDMETASDPFALARAREAFKSWSWIAERRLPSLFGQQGQVSGGNITVVIQRDGQATVTVERPALSGESAQVVEPGADN